MIHLPWPKDDPEREPTPSSDQGAVSPMGETEETGRAPLEAGRHRAEEPELSPEAEADLARRQAIWRQINTAWAEGDAQTLLDISGSDAYDDLIRGAAMKRLVMLGEARRPTVEIPPKPGRFVGRVAMSSIRSRPAALGRDRFQLPIIDKNHP